jgi:hypothetical protein
MLWHGMLASRTALTPLAGPQTKMLHALPLLTRFSLLHADIPQGRGHTRHQSDEAVDLEDSKLPGKEEEKEGKEENRFDLGESENKKVRWLWGGVGWRGVVWR